MSERDDLRDMVRGLLDDKASSEQVRAAVETETGYDPGLWGSLAELGLLGLLVPEQHGGSGAELADMAVLLHELGRRVVPAPVLSSAVLAPAALLASRSSTPVAELLPALATGERRAAVAVGGAEGQLDPRTWCMSWNECSGGFELDGRAGYVVDAPGADVLIVAASGASGLLLAVVDAADATVAATPATDLTRRLGTIVLDRVVVGPERVLAGPGEAEPIVERVQALGALAVAADALGLAEAAMQRTTDYARVRHQFGRPIGSFQAVKHKCANMAVAVECSRAALDTAVAELARTDDHDSTTVSIAKSFACDAAVSVCGDAMQVHGGIGFTWEHDAHLWLKRAVLDRALFGSPSWHRRRVAEAVLPPLEVVS